jgi:hypothetical protein
MAEYRYIFADLLTNEVTCELPLSGVTFSRRLNKAGSFGGSFGLRREGFDDATIIEGTTPGRTVLYIERDGALVWGGVIWSRTWQEQSYSFQYAGQTFESFFFKQDIRNSLIYVNTDQRNILIDLIEKCQAYPFRDLGVITPLPFSNSILRSVTFNDYEAWTFGKAIDYMVEYAQGFDYTIDVRYGTNGDAQKVLLTDDRLGTPVSTSQLVFDYPGSIKNFWYPENASRAATTVYGIGAGEGSSMLRVILTSQQLLDVGYPELVEFYTNKDVSISGTLISKTASELARLVVPLSVPTYETNPEMQPKFGSYQLGDYAKMSIESPRFPDGKDFTTRIVGWDVTPTSSESQEQVKIVVSGEDENDG